MNTRTVALCCTATAVGVFCLAFAWPTIALIARILTDGRPPLDGFTFSGRQLQLLTRSVWLAGCGTVMCLAFSVPGAYLIGRQRSLGDQPWLIALFGATLFCPPMVYVFGWLRLPLVGSGGSLSCLWTWSLWAWPIAALLIGSAWASTGRSSYQAALLSTGPINAFLRVALPMLRRPIALSACLLFILFFNDYGVPHAFGITVYATELLAWAANSAYPIDTVWPAMPAVVVTGVVLVLVFGFCRSDLFDADGSGVSAGPAPGAMVLALLCLGVSWVVPVASLVITDGSWGAARQAAAMYHTDFLYTLACAAAAALIAMMMSLFLSAARPLRTTALVWTVLFGLLPGALIGNALVAAYNRPTFGWLYDHWPICVLGYVARFGWIGMLTSTVLWRRSADRLTEQAAVDGASAWEIIRFVKAPQYWPMLACGGGVIVVLAVAEVPVSTFLRVPDYHPIALVLIEKFHRFEDGILVALSMGLVLTAFAAAWGAAWYIRAKSARP